MVFPTKTTQVFSSNSRVGDTGTSSSSLIGMPSQRKSGGRFLRRLASSAFSIIRTPSSISSVYSKSSKGSGDGGEVACVVGPRGTLCEDACSVETDERVGDEVNGEDVIGKEPKGESGVDLTAERESGDPVRGKLG